ncbi:MAG: hypothetical protein AAB758_03200, partial [Patescibacteria group bacterium]
MLDIFKGGEDYISASKAAEKIGYSSDYIGQLCRAKKIPGKLVGRTWYVDLNSLLEHKKNRKYRKVEKSLPEPIPLAIVHEEELGRSGSRERYVSSLNFSRDDRPLLPQVSKRHATHPRRIVTRKLVREISVVTLSLIVALSVGLNILEQSRPYAAQNIENKLSTISNSSKSFLGSLSSGVNSRLALASVGEFITNPVKGILSGFGNLKDSAMRRYFFATNYGPTMENGPSIGTSTSSLANRPIRVTSTTTSLAIRQTTPKLALDSLKSELRSELQNYIESQLGTAAEPRVVYQSYNTINPTVLRGEILVADTRPLVTRQSDSDAGRVSSVISNLFNDGGSFSKICLGGDCQTSWPTTSSAGAAWAFVKQNDGTQATSTTLGFFNGFLSTASSTIGGGTTGSGLTILGGATTTNLLALGSTTLQNFTAINATTTNATSTTFAITGNAAGLTFYGSGNHDITSSAGTLRIGS